jgi:hypothetical protein
VSLVSLGPGPNESALREAGEAVCKTPTAMSSTPMRTRQKRPIKHEHGGTTVLTDGAEALGRAEELARELPDGWVYIHLEHRGKLNSTSSPRSSRSLAP